MGKQYLLLLVLGCMLYSCQSNALMDTNQTVVNKKWHYTNTSKAEFEITDTTKTYNVNFKLRINTDYRYSNLYVIAKLKDSVQIKKVRYQFKVAKPDGQWLGKGSGDLYTYVFPMLKSHRFKYTGKYTLEIEQNMRDNPLMGVSEVGILITQN